MRSEMLPCAREPRRQSEQETHDPRSPSGHGIFLPPFSSDGKRTRRACLDRDLELIQWLDRLGYHEAWIGEHHFRRVRDDLSSPELFIAIAAERTKFIRFGTGVNLAALPPPRLMVADRIVQLDHHTRGRGHVRGGFPDCSLSDAIMLGIDPDEPKRDRMAEGARRHPCASSSGENRPPKKTDWYMLVNGPPASAAPIRNPTPRSQWSAAVTPVGWAARRQVRPGDDLASPRPNPFGYDALAQQLADRLRHRGRGTGAAWTPRGSGSSDRSTSPRPREKAWANCAPFGFERYLNYSNNNQRRLHKRPRRPGPARMVRREQVRHGRHPPTTQSR